MLQAARRYDFVPRFEVVIVILRFVVLLLGLSRGSTSSWSSWSRRSVQIGLALGPALWVMVHELGHSPHFRGARWADYKALGHISFYMCADPAQRRAGRQARHHDPGLRARPRRGHDGRSSVYNVVSKPFVQLRQTGWMLAYMVMPAVASLAAARDERGLDRVKYDGTRLHIGVLLPVGLLAWLYAGPFLLALDRRPARLRRVAARPG